MNERAPGRAVTLDQYFACTKAYPTRLLTTRSPRNRGETPYAVALRRNVGVNRASAGGLTLRSTRTLDSPYAVTRVGRGAFVEEVVAGGAVEAARAREDESANARLLGEFRQAHRRAVVDRIRQGRVEIAEWIVRK